MAARYEQIIMKQFEKATKEPDEMLIFSMNPDNIREWYIIIRNILGENDEFKDGVYLFRINIPEKFPSTPPEFFALNDNGVYDREKRCCISIGEYHKENYRPVLGVYGFCRELANGLISHKSLLEHGGINLIKTKDSEKVSMAKASLDYIKLNYSSQFEWITDSYKNYSKNWDFSQFRGDRSKLVFEDITP